MNPVAASIPMGRRQVGPGHPCFIVAEIGVNHDGSVNRALELVDAAHEAGADAVKFQWFKADELVTASADTASYQLGTTGHESQQSMLRQLELQPREFAVIRDRCGARRIDFLATPFSQSALQALVDMQPLAIKLASTDLNNGPLQRAAAATGLPLLISTGAATEAEILSAFDRLARWGAAARLALLHCVSAYPTLWESANLNVISTLRQKFRVPIGFSDHTESTSTGALAVAAGACVLEKHLTYRKSADGPDHALSLEPSQFADYVHGVRKAEKALGDGKLGYQAIEAEVRRVARRSVVAACPIPADQILTPEMLALKRPAGGIDPEDLDLVIGRRTRRALAGDEALQWETLV